MFVTNIIESWLYHISIIVLRHIYIFLSLIFNAYLSKPETAIRLMEFDIHKNSGMNTSPRGDAS